MAFSPRNIVGCFLKKRLTKGGGGSRAPQDPPNYALGGLLRQNVNYREGVIFVMENDCYLKVCDARPGMFPVNINNYTNKLGKRTKNKIFAQL